MSAAKILIVEDDSDIREGVRILLESEGYSVEEAEDGFAALKRLSEKTDLVILDVMMPGISGIKTCEEIRKKSYVPIPMRSFWDESKHCFAGIRCIEGKKRQISFRTDIWSLEESRSTWNLTKYL